MSKATDKIADRLTIAREALARADAHMDRAEALLAALKASR